VFLVTIVIINVFGVLGFAEEEFRSSVLKLAAVCIFMVVGLISEKALQSIHKTGLWRAGELKKIWMDWSGEMKIYSWRANKSGWIGRIREKTGEIIA
jgi:hypothetical protein